MAWYSRPSQSLHRIFPIPTWGSASHSLELISDGRQRQRISAIFLESLLLSKNQNVLPCDIAGNAVQCLPTTRHRLSRAYLKFQILLFSCLKDLNLNPYMN